MTRAEVDRAADGPDKTPRFIHDVGAAALSMLPRVVKRRVACGPFDWATYE